MVFPVIFFPSIIASSGGGEITTTLSGILVFAEKARLNKVQTDEGGRTTTGDLASIIAATGKDMYLASVKANIHWNTKFGDDLGTSEIVLKVNNVIKET